MKSRLVKVTVDHIAKGKRSDCEACPIALALQEADPEHRIWEVGVFGAIDRPASVYAVVYGLPLLDLPPLALRFVQAFDNGEDVSPFTFYVNMP